MITSTVRSRSITAYDRLDGHYFTSLGVAASERLAVLEAAGGRVKRLGDFATVWDPPRFARAYAAPKEPGLAYLRPYDVFDFLPAASDRLSLARNNDLDGLTPEAGTILQTCSGRNLGPLTMADDVLADYALSHDMVRVQVDDPDLRFFVLGYLKTATGQALLRRSRAGSVIDHITASDVAAIPLPMLDDGLRATVAQQVQDGWLAMASARQALTAIQGRRTSDFPALTIARSPKEGWTSSSLTLTDRLDAGYYAPAAKAARTQMAETAGIRLGDIASAKLPVRYKRYYVEGDNGRPILSGRQLLQAEPINLRRVSDRSFRDPAEYELAAGMTIFGAVGRSEGRQGVPALITSDRDGWLASNDVMRLIPRPGVRPGALWLAMATSQVRTQVNALSFGSVVDHMNPWDVEELLVPQVSDGDAIEAEQAWARFGKGAQAVAAAVNALERTLSPTRAAQED